MNPSDDLHQILNDNKIDINIWIKSLRGSHLQRSLLFKQTNTFYFRRNLVEYGVKATVSCSMAIALILGGPPFWIIGSAALILKLTTVLLNRFNPKDYVEDVIYEPALVPAKAIEKNKLEDYRLQWQLENKNYFFCKYADKQGGIQQRLACALVMGFVVFTILNASLSLPLAAAGIAYVLLLTDKAQETPPPYLEDKDGLDRLFVLN